jgi:hypothetical protein
LGDAELQHAHGFEGFADAGAVSAGGLVLFRCEEADPAGEKGATFALFGSGASGFQSVGDGGG